MAEHSYIEDPYTCAVCGQDLFPNFMEGCFEHFAKGCVHTDQQHNSYGPFVGLNPVTGKQCEFRGRVDTPGFLGPRRSERHPELILGAGI